MAAAPKSLFHQPTMINDLKKREITMFTAGRDFRNSSMNMPVRGAMDKGVRTEMKTKNAWLMITMDFHFELQFCIHLLAMLLLRIEEVTWEARTHKRIIRLITWLGHQHHVLRIVLVMQQNFCSRNHLRMLHIVITRPHRSNPYFCCPSKSCRRSALVQCCTVLSYIAQLINRFGIGINEDQSQ